MQIIAIWHSGDWPPAQLVAELGDVQPVVLASEDGLGGVLAEVLAKLLAFGIRPATQPQARITALSELGTPNQQGHVLVKGQIANHMRISGRFFFEHKKNLEFPGWVGLHCRCHCDDRS